MKENAGEVQEKPNNIITTKKQKLSNLRELNQEEKYLENLENQEVESLEPNQLYEAVDTVKNLCPQANAFKPGNTWSTSLLDTDDSSSAAVQNPEEKPERLTEEKEDTEDVEQKPDNDDVQTDPEEESERRDFSTETDVDANPDNDAVLNDLERKQVDFQVDLEKEKLFEVEKDTTVEPLKTDTPRDKPKCPSYRGSGKH